MGRGQSAVSQVSCISRDAADAFSDVLGKSRSDGRAASVEEVTSEVLDLSECDYTLRLVKKGEIKGGWPIEVNQGEDIVEFYHHQIPDETPEEARTEWGRRVRSLNRDFLERAKERANNLDISIPSLDMGETPELPPEAVLAMFNWLEQV